MVLAIAWSHLVRDGVFGDGDVLIARLIDTNGDGSPSKGDAIGMGSHQVTADPTSPSRYLAWGVKHHVVATVISTAPEFVAVRRVRGR